MYDLTCAKEKSFEKSYDEARKAEVEGIRSPTFSMDGSTSGKMCPDNT